MAPVEMLIPEGHKLITLIGYKTPEKFVSCKRVFVEGRKRWQFWKPKTIVVYTIIVTEYEAGLYDFGFDQKTVKATVQLAEDLATYDGKLPPVEELAESISKGREAVKHLGITKKKD